MPEDNTPIETPLPQECDANKAGRPCPYHAEIQCVRAWRTAGIDEIMIISRRRDKWITALVSGLLGTLLVVGATAIWGGVELAAGIGEVSGQMSTRLDDVERQVAQDSQDIRRMSRASADGQTTVLVTLGEMREQLRAIDARLQRVEDAQSRRRQR